MQLGWTHAAGPFKYASKYDNHANFNEDHGYPPNIIHMNILDVGSHVACENRSRVKMGNVIASTSIDIDRYI